jgi:hypothetical protein
MKQNPVYNKKYMIIAVTVQIWKFTARNNGGAARQESSPQSATTYISERYASGLEKKKRDNLTFKN